MSIGDRCDILILTATKDEYDTVLSVDSDWSRASDEAGFSFHIRVDRNGLHWAVARAADMGSEHSSITATRLVSELKPKCLGMVGVCAGWRKKVSLGDVIVADRLFRYDTGKLFAQATDLTSQGVISGDLHQYSLDPRWRQLAEEHPDDWVKTIVKYKRPTPFEMQEIWLLKAVSDYHSGAGETPHIRPDRQVSCPDWTAVLDRLVGRGVIEIQGDLQLTDKGTREISKYILRYPDGRVDSYATGHPKLHVAPMATGAKVVEDPDAFANIHKFARKTLAIDMEGAAIAAVAAVEHVEHFIVCKGVQDFADNLKDDRYRFYAIEAAYRFLTSFLNEQYANKNPQSTSSAEPPRAAGGIFFHEVARSYAPAPLLPEQLLRSLPASEEEVQQFNWTARIRAIQRDPLELSAKELFDFLLSRKGRRVLLIANGGYGKSTLLMSMALAAKRRNVSCIFTNAAGLMRDDAEPITTLLAGQQAVLIDGLEDLLLHCHGAEAPEQLLLKLNQFDCSNASICVSGRKNLIEHYIRDEFLYGFQLVELLPWTDSQLQSYFDACEVPYPPSEIANLVRIPFFASIYSHLTADARRNSHHSSYSLLAEFCEQDIQKTRKRTRSPEAPLSGFLEFVAWQMRTLRTATIGNKEFEEFNRVTKDQVATSSILSETSTGLVFRHDLFREYFVACKALRYIRENGGSEVLDAFQTSYQEDVFMADELIRDPSLAEVLRSDLGKHSDVHSVNVMGILAKIRDKYWQHAALSIYESDPPYLRLYEQAVVTRLRFSARSWFGDGRNANELDLEDLMTEIRNGRDPIAACIVIDMLNDADYKKLALQEASEKYKINIEEFVERKGRK